MIISVRNLLLSGICEVFPVARFLLDDVNESFILFIYVSKFSAGGVSSIHFDSLIWFILVFFDVDFAAVSTGVFLL